MAEGREDRLVTPMQQNELATRLEIPKEDHDSIVRELLAEDIIRQRTASSVISVTRKGIEELREIRPFDSQEYVNMAVPTKSRKVFLVHGHDEAVKQSVARFLEKLNLEVIILHEQPNKGRTVIEKFEQHSDVGFACNSDDNKKCDAQESPGDSAYRRDWAVAAIYIRCLSQSDRLDRG